MTPKHIRRLLGRGILVPLALLALFVANAVPASAAPTVSQPDYTLTPDSLNW